MAGPAADGAQGIRRHVGYGLRWQLSPTSMRPRAPREGNSDMPTALSGPPAPGPAVPCNIPSATARWGRSAALPPMAGLASAGASSPLSAAARRGPLQEGMTGWLPPSTDQQRALAQSRRPISATSGSASAEPTGDGKRGFGSFTFHVCPAAVQTKRLAERGRSPGRRPGGPLPDSKRGGVSSRSGGAGRGGGGR